jgi:hypothetical protein
VNNGEITALKDLTSEDGTRLVDAPEPGLMLGGRITTDSAAEPIDIILELRV